MKPICVVVMTLVGIPVLADSPQNLAPLAQTPMEAYHCYVQNKLAPLWYSEMETNKSGLRYSEVKIRLTFHSDGTVSDPKILVGESAGLLKTVTLQLVLDSAPFKPFGDDLIKEMGHTFVDDFTFSVTRPRAGAGMTPAEAEQRIPPPPPD